MSGQLISDRRYMVSVSAENEVGSQPDVESREICELKLIYNLFNWLGCYSN